MPAPGSLAGTLASYVLRPTDLSRGGVHLPSTMTVPEERGSPLVDFLPSYISDAGISEWGMGWQNRLKIQRFRSTGSLDYTAEDGFSTPWGEVVLGDDGAWYPRGLSAFVRLHHPTDDTWMAVTSDGRRWRFVRSVSLSPTKGAYSWSLREVTSIRGEAMRFEYETNATGMQFLRRVTYGGAADKLQYETLFEHEPCVPFTDYRSGRAITLDRRVVAVHMRVRDCNTTAFKERWSYTFRYKSFEFGPAFYLESVQRTYHDGSQEPATRYQYHDAAAVLQSEKRAAWPRVTGLVDAIRAHHVTYDPEFLTFFDGDQRGQLDVEIAPDYSLLRHDGGQWVNTPLADDTVDSTPYYCRPPTGRHNGPRRLTRLRPQDSEPVAIACMRDFLAARTVVCSRTGETLHVSAKHSRGFSPEGQSVWADLQRNGYLDMVLLNYGGYKILKNVSTAAGYAFIEQPEQKLEPQFEPLGVWVCDINGDGLLDLVGKFDAAFMVWFGKGDGGFTSQGQGRILYGRSNHVVYDLGSYNIEMFDANHDGLADMLLTKDREAFLFLNQGDRFVEVPVPALDALDTASGKVLVANIGGTGETELHFPGPGGLTSMALTRPGIGLLKEVDDGKGNRIELEYSRAQPYPGLRQRLPVVSQSRTVVGGEGEKVRAVGYGTPKIHSKAGYLLGFETIEIDGPNDISRSRFIYSDDVSGLLIASEHVDKRQPSLRHFSEHTYEAAHHAGLDWLRPQAVTTGWSDATSQRQSVQTTRYSQFVMSFCPAITETMWHGKTLRVEQKFAEVAALHGLPHCLPEVVREVGTHPNAALNFAEGARVERNVLGQPVALYALGDAGVQLTLQVAYDNRQRVVQTQEPGATPVQAVYEDVTGLLQEVTGQDGVRTRLDARHPISDAVKGVSVFRDPQTPFRVEFMFGPEERLEKTWNNSDGSSSSQPSVEYNYLYGTSQAPAQLRTRQLVQPSAGLYSEALTLQTASGRQIADLHRVGDTWVPSTLQRWQGGLLQQERWRRARPFGAAGPFTYAGLFEHGALLHREEHSALGTTLHEWAQVDASIGATIERQVSVTDLGVSTLGTRNHAVTTNTTVDASGAVLQIVDEVGEITYAEHDALGRLRRVILPGGGRHEVDYDTYGRMSRSWRDGVGAATYLYGPSSQKLAGVLWNDSESRPLRQVEMVYDAQGRLAKTVHSDAKHAPQIFSYFYDGARPDGNVSAAQGGFLTGVSGPGFTRTANYRLDGVQSTSAITLQGWRSVQKHFISYADGTPRLVETSLYDLDRQQKLYAARWEFDKDAWGRDAGVRRDGQVLYLLEYDALGRIAGATVGPNSRLELAHNDVTGQRDGVRLRTPKWQSQLTWTRSREGNIADERLQLDRHQEASSTESQSRAYDYDARKFLTAADGQDRSDSYSYDAAGLPFAGAALPLDAAGRQKRLEGRVLDYGPDGRLQAVSLPWGNFSFLYDEIGRRLAKLKEGAVVEAYLEEGLLNAAGLSVPVRVGGHLVGVAGPDALQLYFTDPRGTTVVSPSGTLSWPQPFGNRLQAPTEGAAAWAAHLDYVGAGRDTDLGLVRLGARDYDPSTSRFTTPDPAVLADAGLCLIDPVQCNLYAYARNNPLLYDDPDGKFAHIAAGAGIGAAVGLGIEGSRQAWAGELSTRRLVAASLGGAAAGAVTASTGGAGAIVLQRMGASVAANVVGSAVSRQVLGESQTLTDLGVDAAAGAATFGLFHGASQARTLLRVVKAPMQTPRQLPASPVAFAQSLQLKNRTYGEPDAFKSGILRAEMLISQRAKGPSDFYFYPSLLRQAGHSPEALWSALQVAPHDYFGYCAQISVFRVRQDIPAAFGRALKNPNENGLLGGARQIVVQPEFQQFLDPLFSIKIGK